MERIEDLKLRRSTPLLEVFPVSLYSASWVKDYNGSIGERQLIYDQVAPAEGSDISEETVSFLNAALLPTRKNNERLNDERGIRKIHKKLIDDTSEMWAIALTGHSWCVGCMGGSAEIESYDWYWRDDLTPVTLEGLFEGEDWRRRVAIEIARAVVNAQGERDGPLTPEMAAPWLDDLSIWRFTEGGVKILHRMSYYTVKYGHVDLDRLARRGVTRKRRAGRLTP